MTRVLLGDYPTPIEPLPTLSRPGVALWVKRDDLTAPVYGGNKVRKLEYVLGDARAHGKTELLTAGAVGSHHVLATTIYGVRSGFRVKAVLVPQPKSEHALVNLRAELAQGLDARASSEVLVPVALGRRYHTGSYYVQVGGSSALGAMGYVDGARELAAQVRAGQMPTPDLVVVTLGSGGTAAGLAAGFALEGLPTRVLGVSVVGPTQLFAWYTHHLARACVERAGGSITRQELAARLVTTARWLGRGYGYPTDDGARAAARAADCGLTLDGTYTAKSFAAALDVVQGGREKVVLYWHTLSSAPMAPLLEGAPAELPASLTALLR
jgi:1-aminocyclopropane-1-carboxylate deaminase/D-cysteine desulfhydrase-like pyridoxal-dependent ACC family enzyme